MTRMQAGFGALILAQAAHSVEEYLGRLWESFPPARALTGLVSQDLERGFLIINVALVAFGVWCFLWPVRRGWRSAAPLAWGWVVIETINGIGHPLWALRQGGYTPGVVTAPVLLILAIYLARQLRHTRVTSTSLPLLLLGSFAGINSGCRPAPAAPSDITEIPGTAGCGACEIIAEEAVVLSGPASAFVEWPQSAWTDSRARILLAQPNKQVLPAAFAPDGKFLHHLGREGEGPGEFRYAAHLTADAHDSVWIADWGTGRLSIFGPDSRFVRSFPVPSGLLSLALLPEGNLVAAAPSFDGGKAVVPLQRWDRGGVRVAGYGPPVKSSGYEYQYLLAAASDGGFWAVRLWGRLLLLRVDSAGGETWYERRPEWFKGIPAEATNVDHDVSAARAIWEDAAGLVWIVFKVAAESSDIAMDTVRPEGVPVAVPRDPDAAYDTMVEVLDPRRGELVAAHRFPELLTVSAGAGRLIRVVETDAGLRVSVITLRLQRP